MVYRQTAQAGVFSRIRRIASTVVVSGLIANGWGVHDVADPWWSARIALPWRPGAAVADAKENPRAQQLARSVLDRDVAT